MTATDTEPVAPEAGRHFVRHGPSRRWMTVFLSLLALTMAAAAVLTYVGIKTVRSSRAGQSVSTVTDPAAPGFEAFLEPSPTLAILHRDGLALQSIAVLALNTGDAGGSVLLVSPNVQGADREGALSLAAVAAYNLDPAAAMPALQAQLGFGITEVAIVDDARWEELVAPVAPLQVDNPTAVGPFPAGPISLTADQVGDYLAAVNPGESTELAVIRQRAFYRAWIDAISASSDPAAVPGEVASGLGRFMRGVAAGPNGVNTTPVVEELRDGLFRTKVDAAAMAALIPELVPFPVAGEPGGRVRVRLLDGTGDPKHVQLAAPLVIPADAEIVVVGNADAFDYRETEIRYHNPLAETAARALQESLGAGQLVDDPRQTDAFDVTIVLGPDL